MSDDDLAQLEAAARAAHAKTETWPLTSALMGDNGWQWDQADAEFIAAASPTAVLAIIERARRVEAFIGFLCEDSGVDFDAEIDYLRGEGPDPWEAHRVLAQCRPAIQRANAAAMRFVGDPSVVVTDDDEID